MGSWFSSGDEPWCLQPNYLEKWYSDKIHREEMSFQIDCYKAVDRVVSGIGSCFKHGDLFDVREVVKGGSFGKGTMVKDLSDVDLVVFINLPHLQPISSSSPEDYRDQLKVVIEYLKKALMVVLPNVKIISDSHLVNFAIQVGPSQRSLEVNLLPTADNFFGCALGPSDVFKEMLQKSGYDRGFYSASLVKFQRDFVRDQPNCVRELIRLVKYWAYTKLPKALQKSYPLELITIHRWEKAGKPARFSKVQGLKDVLRALTNLKGLRHYWEDFYDTEMAEQSITKLRHRNPIVLDPANPANNVCWVYQKGDNVRLVEDAAEITLDSTLFCNVFVQSSWEISNIDL